MRAKLRLIVAAVTLQACAASDPAGGTDDGTGEPSTGAEAATTTGSASEMSSSTVTSSGPSQGTTSSSSADLTSTSDGSGSETTSGFATSTTAARDTSSGAEASSTGELLGPQWADTTLTYTGPAGVQVIDVQDCTFCDATINGTTLLIRYQQAEGWTVWTLDIPVGAGAGSMPITDDYSGAYVAINEQGQDLPPGYAGFYAPTTGSGTLTLTDADISPGGVVAGTLSASLSLGEVDAQLETEFYAEIPQ